MLCHGFRWKKHGASSHREGIEKDDHDGMERLPAELLNADLSRPKIHLVEC
jgi:hypothetical protein